MKRFIMFVMLAFGVVSCSGCAKKTPPPEVVETHPAPAPTATPTNPPPPVDTTDKVAGETWEFTLPNKDWTSLAQQGNSFLLLINPVLENAITFETFGYAGTLDSLVLANLRDMRNKGVTLNSAKQTELNGTKFVLVDATKGSNQVFTWVGVHNNNAYAFSCGGEISRSFKELCTGIASTIKLH